MRRIASFADTHLLGPGIPGASQTGWRQEDFLVAANRVAKEIVAWKPDLILFAGDAFHSRNPSQKAIFFFAKIVYDLTLAAPIVLVPGNHDLTAWGSVLRVLGFAEGVHYIGEPGAIEVNGIQVFGMPWAHRAHQTAKMDGPDEMEMLANVGIRAFLAQPFDGPRIFLGHLTMLGADYNFGPAAISLGREVFWQPSWLDGFDAALLGHLHKHQFPDPSRPHICYAGSTERLDFGERDQEKGWVSIDLDDEEPAWEFHPIPSRPMVQIDFGRVEKGRKILINEPDAIVKPVIQLGAGQPVPEIVAECRHLMPPTLIYEEREREWRAPKGFTEKPVDEMLESYFESRQIEPERIEVLMECGKEIINARQEELADVKL
jgi:exonuclease SbcD